MKTILWKPRGKELVMPCGMVEVEPGQVLTPEDHLALVEARLFDLIQESRLTFKGLQNLIEETVNAMGWTVVVSSKEAAPTEMMLFLDTRLKMDGALISEPRTMPKKEAPGLRDLWEETTLERWLNLAATPIV